MTEIKRYEIERADEELDNIFGEWVRFEDHAAIVAALQEQVRALAAEVSECRRFVAKELGPESGIQFAALSTERSDEVLREIRAQGVDESAAEVDSWVGCDLLAQELRKKSSPHPGRRAAMSEFERKPDGGLNDWIETYEAMGGGENDAEMLCLLLE